MTNQVKQQHVELPKAFNQQDYEALEAQAVDKVMNGYYTSYERAGGGAWHYPAADERQFFQSFEALIEYVGEQAVKGIKVYPHDAPQCTIGHFSITYYKTQSEIDELIEEAKAQAKTDYIASIEAFNSEQVRILQDQLVAAELAKEAKKEQDKLEALKAKSLKIAQEHIASQLKEAN